MKIFTNFFTAFLFLFLFGLGYTALGHTSEAATVSSSPTYTQNQVPIYDRISQVGGPLNLIRTTGDYAYLDGVGIPLTIIDITNPMTPTKLIETQFDYVNDMFLDNEIAFVASQGELTIVDFSNPYSPLELSTIPFSYEQVFYENGYLYYLGYTSLKIADVTDLSNPLYLGEYAPNVPVTNMYFTNGFGYLCGGNASGNENFQIIDVSAPANVQVLSLVFVQSRRVLTFSFKLEQFQLRQNAPNSTFPNKIAGQSNFSFDLAG